MTDATRSARIARQTAETQIELSLELDGSGAFTGSSGIGFFDHMLSAFSRHGLFCLELKCTGDLHVDQHHTVEDVGICLGQAVSAAVADKSGIGRFGHAYVPMDESLARSVVDISGRACLVYEARFTEDMVGNFPVSLAREFFAALAQNARISLHLDLLRGTNAHHAVEALFKACARSLDMATALSGRSAEIPSTKGSL